MRKGSESVYDKWNISVVICDTDFHNGQPSHGGDRNTLELMTSTLPRETLGTVASLLAATLYQGNPDRNNKLWNIVSTDIYTLTKVHDGKIEIIFFVVKFLSYPPLTVNFEV